MDHATLLYILKLEASGYPMELFWTGKEYKMKSNKCGDNDSSGKAISERQKQSTGLDLSQETKDGVMDALEEEAKKNGIDLAGRKQRLDFEVNNSYARAIYNKAIEDAARISESYDNEYIASEIRQMKKKYNETTTTR